MRWVHQTHILSLLTGAVFCFLFMSAFRKTPDLNENSLRNYEPFVKTSEKVPELGIHPERIPCSIDGHDKFHCIRDENEVYVPFEKYLRKQFDVTGRIVIDSKTSLRRFEWHTSSAKVKTSPDSIHYDPTGPFGHFGSYNVENRDRVRCISAENGLPLSTQWASRPYIYPIQIAQYALQHYSHNLTDPEPKIVPLGVHLSSWSISPEYASSTTINEMYDQVIHDDVIELITDPTLDNPGIWLLLDDDPSLHLIEFTWSPSPDASFTVAVQVIATNVLFKLTYIHGMDSRCVWLDDDFDDDFRYEMAGTLHSFSYSLGIATGNYTTIIRDIFVDVVKAMMSVGQSETAHLRRGAIRLLSLGFRGRTNIGHRPVQRSSAHMGQFLLVADWLVGSQNRSGGWPIPVKHSLAKQKLVLHAGWHSAMAQGHAMSVLTRAYKVTGEKRYLDTAIKATTVFSIPSSEGGVLNHIFDCPWYEEYPTNPGSFVLNGFMYSLIGLYDLSSQLGNRSIAHALYRSGLASLERMLSLFDTGSGSVYDLRHVSLVSTAPNLARWDYHAVHIDLLLWLYNIENTAYLRETAERWIGYAQGKRAKHN